MSIRYRIYCITEAIWKYGFGSSPISVCPTNAGHTVNANSVTDVLTNSLGFTIYNAKVTSLNYTNIARINFPGTNKLILVPKINVIGKTASGSFSIKIVDITNGTVIATKTDTSTTETVIDMGTISNLTTGSAIWEVQIKSITTAVETELNYVELIYCSE